MIYVYKRTLYHYPNYLFSTNYINIKITLIGVVLSRLFLLEGILLLVLSELFYLLLDLETDGDRDRFELYFDFDLLRVCYNSDSNELILDLFFLS